MAALRPPMFRPQPLTHCSVSTPNMLVGSPGRSLVESYLQVVLWFVSGTLGGGVDTLSPRERILVAKCVGWGVPVHAHGQGPVCGSRFSSGNQT